MAGVYQLLGSRQFKTRQLALARGKLRSAKTEKQKRVAEKNLKYLLALFK